jgi:hypothetical protein
MLTGFVFLGGRETGNVLSGGGTFGADTCQGFLFGARFAEDDHGAESLGVQAGDQVGVASAILFPKLANLDFRNAHRQSLNVVCQRRGVNCPAGPVVGYFDGEERIVA